MLKKFVSSLLVILVLTGCSSGGGSSSSSKANAADLAASLVKDLKLEDKVVSTEDRIIQGLMFFPEDAVEESALYLSNDKKADTVGVFKAKDAEACKECIETYRETLKSQMQSYAPGETFKVDSAIIEEKNGYVIFVICDNLEDARKIVEKL
ncbi:MAG: DUF4358 domain-containing protein [Solobacterium sp.]|nr:DUF4358 domain-containing protein [Solobacterium sp.]